MTDSAPTIIVRAKCGDVLGELGDPRLEKMEWCEVPEGEFLMECTEYAKEIIVDEMIEYWTAQEWKSSSRQELQIRMRQLLPQHKVYLPSFRIGRFSVTNQEFSAFVKCGGYQQERCWIKAGLLWLNREPKLEEALDLPKQQRRNGRIEPAFWNDLQLNIHNRAVVGITWFEAMAYCSWFTEQLKSSGELAVGYVARLPSEAEWEKAARGTDGRFWSWGNEWQDNFANTHVAGLSATCSVAMFAESVSPYGAFDMAGNVKEWCRSLPAQYPYDSNDGREKIDQEGLRAVRGNSWYIGKYSSRCTYRRHFHPDTQLDALGFRVVIGPKLE